MQNPCFIARRAALVPLLVLACSDPPGRGELVDQITSLTAADDAGSTDGASSSELPTSGEADTTATTEATSGAETDEPVCGDGVVQPPEGCDDANDDNSDGCVEGCKLAICGDGFVGPGEACDDGDDEDTNACTTQCTPPSCSDGFLSGDETDTDCGGDACVACALGADCTSAADCESGACAQGGEGSVCVHPASCKALLVAFPGASDGIYTLDGDGAGAGEPFMSYCDMTTDGGGWTLAMRFAPEASQFEFYSPHWTTDSLVNADELVPTTLTDGKFPAYNLVSGSEIRGCLRHPKTKSYACKHYPLNRRQTLLSLFATTPIGSDTAKKGLFFEEADAQKLEWLTIQGRTLADSSIPVDYIATGINVDDDQSCYDARVRFGMVLNNESTIWTLNDAAGFGAQAFYSSACDIPNGQNSPWRTGSGFVSGPIPFTAPGHIWIR